jgi:hypothetical protein
MSLVFMGLGCLLERQYNYSKITIYLTVKGGVKLALSSISVER